jgi:hypothetical protein
MRIEGVSLAVVRKKRRLSGKKCQELAILLSVARWPIIRPQNSKGVE